MATEAPSDSQVHPRVRHVFAIKWNASLRRRSGVGEGFGKASVSALWAAWGSSLKIPRQQTNPLAINDNQQNPLSSPRGFSDAFAGIQGNFPEQSSPGQDPFRQDGSIPAAANIDETIASTDLHATSDALNMLSHAAQLDTYASPGQRSHASGRLASVLTPGQGGVTPASNNVGNDPLQYALIAQGLMTASQVIQLIARYACIHFPRTRC